MHASGIQWSGAMMMARLAKSLFAVLSLAIFVFAPAARGADRPDQPPQDQISADETPVGEAPLPGAKAAPDAGAAADAKPAARERLVIGDAYMLEVTRGGVTRSFGGNLLKASDKWIVLRRMASGRNDYGVPLLSAIPKVGNAFRRSYESLVEDDLWIPRQAATIVSHRHVVTTAAAKSGVGNEPMVRTRCGVVFAHGDKFERRDGELTAVNDDKVTVLTTGPFRAPYPQQIARDEILCISIPVVISNVRMTERDSSKDRK